MNSTRVDLKPLFAVVTLTIGLGLVAVINIFRTTGAPPQGVRVVVSPNAKAEPILPTKVELSCYDPQILPIWSVIKNEHEFRVRLQSATGLLSCSDMLEIKRVELNGDGIDEFLVRGKGQVQCGSTGNCNYWIFGFQNGRVTTLLSAVHEADQHEFGEELRESRTNGYRDVLVASRDGQDVLHFRTYSFGKAGYQESNCMSEVPKLLSEGAGSWELITCNEFYRRQDEDRLYEMKQARSHADE